MVKASSKLILACIFQQSLTASGLRVDKDLGMPAELNNTRLQILYELQHGHGSGLEEELNAYDCEKLSHMCQAPFNCEKWTTQDTVDLRMKGIAIDKRSNPRAWCMPGLEKYTSTLIKECVVNNNPKKAAKLLFKRAFEDGDDELEASYCFHEGHCTTTVLKENSTRHDMEFFCDMRFGGRNGWTKNSIKNMKRLMSWHTALPSLVSRADGFKSQRLTRTFTKMSCEMGTLGCDIMYCKNTYCKDEHYVNKYQKYLPREGGDKFEDPEMTKEYREAHAEED